MISITTICIFYYLLREIYFKIINYLKKNKTKSNQKSNHKKGLAALNLDRNSSHEVNSQCNFSKKLSGEEEKEEEEKHLEKGK